MMWRDSTLSLGLKQLCEIERCSPLFRRPLPAHSRRPRGSQLGREKRLDESFQVRAKLWSAFSPDSTDGPWVSEDGPYLVRIQLNSLVFDKLHEMEYER